MLITTDDVPCMLIACLIKKNEYGWKVGPEYMHAKPADASTILIAC